MKIIICGDIHGEFATFKDFLNKQNPDIVDDVLQAFQWILLVAQVWAAHQQQHLLYDLIDILRLRMEQLMPVPLTLRHQLLLLIVILVIVDHA